jgi:hypothetical protein
MKMAESSNMFKNIVAISCMIIATAITVGALLLACGSVVGDIEDNKDDIVKIDVTLELHAKEIVQGKMDRTAQATVTKNTLNVLTSINTKLETVIQIQGVQATDIALIKQAQKDRKEK